MKNFLRLPVVMLDSLIYLKGTEQIMITFSCISLLVMIFASLTAFNETEQLMMTSKNFTRELAHKKWGKEGRAEEFMNITRNFFSLGSMDITAKIFSSRNREAE